MSVMCATGCVSESLYKVTYTIYDGYNEMRWETSDLIKADSMDEAKEFAKKHTVNPRFNILNLKVEPTVCWKEKEKEISPSDLMPVICIKERKAFPNSGIKDEKYFIQRSSIYMDPDGTVYGSMFDDNKGTKFLSIVRLDRFMSI